MQKTNIFIASNRVNTNFLYAFLHENNVKFIPIRGGQYGLNSFATDYLGVTSGDCNVSSIGFDSTDNENLKSAILAEDSFYKIGVYSTLIDEFLKKEEHDDYVVFEGATHYEGENLIGVGNITAKKLLEICKAEDENIKTATAVKITTSSGILGVKRR